MDNFIKISGSIPKLSGYQKAAILLGELGPEASKEVKEFIKLTQKENKKLRNAFKNLGPYPRNINDIIREEKVLAEAINYGKVKGIYTPIEKVDLQAQYLKKNQAQVSKMLNDSPDTITNVIKNWLDQN
ncbi:MAG: hypothetical protein K5866_07475 [Treponema sp.]|nr:hypothetical protein [Treponema sp.]